MKISLVFVLIPLCIMQILSEEALNEVVQSTSSSITLPSYYNPSRPVYYHYDDQFIRSKVNTIFNQINKYTCLNFKPTIDTSISDPIVIKLSISKDGSNKIELPEKSGYPSIVSLTKDVYNNGTSLRFYLGMALGLIPEVRRPNREIDVEVEMNSVQEDYKQYYEPAKLADVSYLENTEFDFKSPMFFGSHYGNKTEKSTYTVKLYEKYEYFSNGGKVFRHNDYRHIFNYYCKNVVNKKNDCMYGGYYPKKESKQCKCPEHFDGPKCEKLKENKNDCKSIQQKIIATRTKSDYTVKINKGTCYFNISSSEGKKNVSITIEQLTLKNNDCETFKSNVEVLVRNDKGAAGINLCKDRSTPLSLPALSREVFLVFNSQEACTSLKFS